MTTEQQMTILDNLCFELGLWMRTNYIIEVIEPGYASPDGSHPEDFGWSFKFDEDADEQIEKIKERMEEYLKSHDVPRGDTLYLRDEIECFPDLTTRDRNGQFTEGYGWFTFCSFAPEVED